MQRRIHLPFSAEAPRLARRQIVRIVSLPREMLEDVLLLVTELVTNSVRHADDRGGGIDVVIDCDDRHVRVEVIDDGPGVPAAPRQPAPTADRHWGLFIVRRVADDWGAYTNGRGHVWFELYDQDSGENGRSHRSGSFDGRDGRGRLNRSA